MTPFSATATTNGCASSRLSVRLPPLSGRAAAGELNSAVLYRDLFHRVQFPFEARVRLCFVVAAHQEGNWQKMMTAAVVAIASFSFLVLNAGELRRAPNALGFFVIWAR
jgi:hypothetical protein